MEFLKIQDSIGSFVLKRFDQTLTVCNICAFVQVGLEDGFGDFPHYFRSVLHAVLSNRPNLSASGFAPQTDVSHDFLR